MTRLMKYTKPYLPMILLAIALLFAQANFDLALPDYLSKIVNTGIQQGGVENAVPLAIRQQELERSLLFMNPDEKSLVLGAYELINESSSDYENYLEEYPILDREAIYILKSKGQSTIDQLNLIMAKNLLVVHTLEQFVTDPSKAAQMQAIFGFIPSNATQMFFILSQLTPPTLAQISVQINQNFETLGDSMIIQAGIQVVRSEYEALEMDTGKLEMNYLFRIGGMMLLLTLLSAVCIIGVSYLSARTASGMARDIRRDVFKKVESFSNTEFDTFSTASLITRSTNDITQIQMVTVMLIRMVFFAPIMGIGGIIRALSKDTSMWWLIAVAVFTLISIILTVFLIAFPKFQLIQKLVDRLNLVAREHLSGMMVIRAFNKQKFEENRFNKANLDLTSISLFITRVMVIMMPLMMLIMNGLSISIMWVGAHQVANAVMQVGDMMAFLQYAMQIVFSFLMISMMFIILPRATVSVSRVMVVLNTEPAIRDPLTPKKFSEPFNASIEFRNVSFRYPKGEEDALQNISFTAYPGQTTAFIGATGAGKSTIVNLIPRFYDVSSGSILIDGVDIREVTQYDLRNKIGYVPQKSALFSGTIESNLRFADESAIDEILNSAVDIAQAKEFITSKSDGMGAEIAQGGMNVSGGQKQRLSIARALVKKPPIYIFDDSFSSLDFKTDAALRKALKQNTSGSTLMIVTQRISTIMNAEQIIVIDEGKIVGKGTHSELMKNCSYYKEIALSQLSLEELT